MALSLFSINVCQFSSCGLYFATLCELLQHIEETHIPSVEVDLKTKEENEKALGANQQASSSEETTKSSSSSTPTLSLSAIYKFFPVLPAQKALPIKHEPTKISFCHYRKKPTPPVNVVHYTQPSAGEKTPTPSRSENDEEMSNDSFRNEDGDEGENSEYLDERRHKCPVDGCNKRYKNLQGARYHARQVHGYCDDASNAMNTVDIMPPSSGSQSPLTQPPTPSKSANLRPYKCSQCSKRYKTVVGLNNHVQQSHQRLNTVSTQSITSNLVPVSPSAVSNSTTSHLQSSSDSSHGSAMLNKPMMSQTGAQGQMGVALSSTHISNSAIGGPPPGVRVTTQPVQTAPPPTAGGHQYHHQSTSISGGNPSAQPNIQVRTVGSISGAARSGSLVGTQIAFSSMIDNSQQADQRASMQPVQPKMPQRIASAGNLSMLNRNQYQHNQTMVHRVKMAAAGVNPSLGSQNQYSGSSSGQILSISSAPSSSSSMNAPQTVQQSGSQMYQHQPSQ